MAVHHPLVPIKIIAPEFRQQHLSGEHPPRRTQERMEQFKLPGGQFQGTAVQQRLPGVQVDHQIPVAQTVLLLSPAAPAKDDPNLLQQHRHGKWLGHIVVDVQAEAPELLFLSVQGGKHENRYLRLLAD